MNVIMHAIIFTSFYRKSAIVHLKNLVRLSLVLVSIGVGFIFFTVAGMQAVFWICVEHRVDNIEMFLLLLSRV